MYTFSSTVDASAGGTTYSKPYIVDIGQNPCNIGIGITVAGSAECTLQHTFSDPFATNLAVNTNGIWINNSTVTSASSNQVTNYAFPCRAIRLALHAATSAQAILNVVQSLDGA